MFYLSLFTFVFFVAVTMADVKKEYGEFRLNHIDLAQKQISLQRIYSSRSLFKGYFGYNWCSSLDYKLTVTPSQLTVYDCEIGKFIVFEKVNEVLFRNEDRQMEITANSFSFHYVTPSVTYFFSRAGLLSHWITKGKSAVYVIYKNQKISHLLVKKVPPQSITISKEGWIQKIGSQLTYEYKQGVLKKVFVKQKPVWLYEYDEFLNMIQWRSSNHYELMKYDSEWDRIVFLKDKNDCRFHFQYEIKEARKYIFESQKCINSSEHNSVFEIISPRLLVKAPTDTLGKEFRKVETASGGNDVQVF